MNIIKRNKMKISVILITLILTATIMYFNVYRFNGYKVSIGKSTITYVKSKREFNKAYKQLQNEIKSKYKNVIIKEDFTVDSENVDDVAMFMSGDNLKNIMLKKFNIVVDGFLMKSDNRKIAYVRSENQGKEILDSVKDYYSNEAKLNSITKIEIVNKISYESVVVKMGNLYENSEIVRELIKYNTRAQVPFINIKTVGNISKQQVIYPTTIIKSTGTLMNGVKKIQHEGKEGIKQVTTEVIVQNNKRVSEKVLKSEIIKPVQNKEIFMGNYKPIILGLNYMNTPSRGSISSNFGMRWGKMHKGVDIAAAFGATINVVLDGTVTYAAWQDGYGNVIKIDHGEGIETTYAHCSVINVKKGEVVKLGEKIGEVGSTGNSTGPHLHFEVRKNGEAQNPQKYIK
ncbi:M23 family metallopeptidase [Clostridium sp. CF012]|uniref:M23 family metallopeptidase n=1 Tax=Clostridium sp. CF012 TaxID=2843319 RepID=UPI001C0C8A37|nr:peptidoglycan DD-metalloendopeptidase family protein [Clostridium sp. CF012]MBU3144529.1 peptidoglycan DD-metalloendopeptidase family protein [Clostridium sp. CF012]